MNKRHSKGKGHGGKGPLCQSHHRKLYEMIDDMGKKRRMKFPNHQCFLCGWVGPCDRHRLISGKDGGKYVPGNVVSLCPNDHRLYHFKKLSQEKLFLLEQLKTKERTP
jgi:hypothetical protein